MKKLIIALFILILLSSCSKEQGGIQMELKVTSPAFENNGKIPAKYIADGQNINPPLNIANTPQKTKSLVLIVDDPDAPSGTWIHWLVWNIPPNSKIEENSIPGIQGLNSFQEENYRGPSPPSGTHRYFFKVYALDISLDISESSRKQDVEKAMKNHILAKGELIGLYSRK